MKLKINEIYYSIQGESSYMGKPCIFIRLTYCNLRCSYCDSEYTFHDGNNMLIDEKDLSKYARRRNIFTRLKSHLETELKDSIAVP